MPRQSCYVLSDAIGRYRAACAHAMGKTRETIDSYCRPQPAPTPQDCDNTGRANPLDRPNEIRGNAEFPRILEEAVLDAWGYLPVRRGRHLVASAAILADEAEQLCREDHRRKPKLTPAQITDLRDNIIEAAHRLAEQLLTRREKPRG